MLLIESHDRWVAELADDFESFQRGHGVDEYQGACGEFLGTPPFEDIEVCFLIGAELLRRAHRQVDPGVEGEYVAQGAEPDAVRRPDEVDVNHGLRPYRQPGGVVPC